MMIVPHRPTAEEIAARAAKSTYDVEQTPYYRSFHHNQRVIAQLPEKVVMKCVPQIFGEIFHGETPKNFWEALASLKALVSRDNYVAMNCKLVLNKEMRAAGIKTEGLR